MYESRFPFSISFNIPTFIMFLLLVRLLIVLMFFIFNHKAIIRTSLAKNWYKKPNRPKLIIGKTSSFRLNHYYSLLIWFKTILLRYLQATSFAFAINVNIGSTPVLVPREVSNIKDFWTHDFLKEQLFISLRSSRKSNSLNMIQVGMHIMFLKSLVRCITSIYTFSKHINHPPFQQTTRTCRKEKVMLWNPLWLSREKKVRQHPRTF